MLQLLKKLLCLELKYTVHGHVSPNKRVVWSGTGCGAGLAMEGAGLWREDWVVEGAGSLGFPVRDHPSSK